MTTPYVDQALRHAGSAEVLFTGMFDEPAGTIARSVPRNLCTTGAIAILTATTYVRLVPLAAGTVIKNLAVHTGTTAQATGTHGWFALLDQYLNVLGVTADQTGAAFFAASTFTILPVTAPFVIAQTGPYYGAVSISAGTMPTLSGPNNTAAGLSNVAPQLFGTAGASSTPPAVGSQVNSGTIAGNGFNFGFWVS